MNTQEKAALESLVIKLNTLRRTLSDEERAFLDQMVISTGPEMILHAMHSAVDEQVDQVVTPSAQANLDATLDASLDDEVILHAATPGRVIDQSAFYIDMETENYVINIEQLIE